MAENHVKSYRLNSIPTTLSFDTDFHGDEKIGLKVCELWSGKFLNSELSSPTFRNLSPWKCGTYPALLRLLALKTLEVFVFKLKTSLTYEFISVDAIFDQLNAVNETLTSDFETLHNDMDAMELKHEQAIGKYIFKF